MLVKMVKTEVTQSTRSRIMWLLFGILGGICLVGFAWFMPMPGLPGGDEFVSDMFMYASFFFIGLAVLGYHEEK